MTEKSKDENKFFKKDQFYICDPKKNTTCKGRYGELCGKQCTHTMHKEYSLNV